MNVNLFKKIQFWVVILILSFALLASVIVLHSRNSQFAIELNPEWIKNNLTVEASLPSVGSYTVSILAYPKNFKQSHWFPKFNLEQFDSAAGAFVTLPARADHTYVINVTQAKIPSKFNVHYVPAPDYEKEVGLTDAITDYQKSELRFKLNETDTSKTFPPLFMMLAMIGLAFIGLFYAILTKIFKTPLT